LKREPGLNLAIKAVGGVAALARSVGVSQPAVSAWERVPPERVLAVEAASGVSRDLLRPDLYRKSELAETLDPVDQARSNEYALLGSLLWRAPDANLLETVAGLKGDGSPLGMAHLALAELAGSMEPETIGREFFDLFIGVGRGELLPYASYYLTGFLHERPLAEVRGDLERLGLARTDRAMEPEDHAGLLFDVMAGLIRRDFSADGIDDEAFFRRHLQPWAGRLFADLEVASAARFYRAVGRIGSVFMEIEAEAMSLPA
jgi:TorA maturation chaperone TorD